MQQLLSYGKKLILYNLLYWVKLLIVFNCELEGGVYMQCVCVCERERESPGGHFKVLLLQLC